MIRCSFLKCRFFEKKKIGHRTKEQNYTNQNSAYQSGFVKQDCDLILKSNEPFSAEISFFRKSTFHLQFAFIHYIETN